MLHTRPPSPPSNKSVTGVTNSENQLLVTNPVVHYPSRHAWLAFFDKALLIIGAMALGLAVVFFIAYNWANMGKIGKFALVEGTLALSIAGYAIVAYQRRFQLAQQLLLLVACILTGSLLALFGQTYQTGADTWQLFFNWALLIIPWVLIARLPALWLLWLGLMNISISLFVNTNDFLFQTFALSDYVYAHNDNLSYILLTLLNGAALHLWLVVMGKPASKSKLSTSTQAANSSQASDTGDTSQISDTSQILATSSATPNKVVKQRFTKPLLIRKYHWSIYVVGAVATYYATRVGISAALGQGNPLSITISLILWAAFIGYLYWHFRRLQIDLLMLTYGCISAIFVVICCLIEPLFSHIGDIGFLLITILISSMSGGSVLWLRSLSSINTPSDATSDLTASTQMTQPADDRLPADNWLPTLDINTDTNTDSAPPSDALPWYLHLLIGLGGIISGLFMIGFIALIFSNIIEQTMTQLVFGIVLLATSIFIFYHNRKLTASTQVFVSSIAFPFSMAGQVFLAFALYNLVNSKPALAISIIAIQVVLYILIRDFLHRLLTALIALSCLLWLFSYYHAPEVSNALLALILGVFSLQSTEFLQLIAPQKRAQAHALFRPLAYASMLLLLTASGAVILTEYGRGIAGTVDYFDYHYPLAQGLLIASSLYATQLILKRYHLSLISSTGLIIAIAVIALGGISLYVSGLLATCLVLVIAKANQQKSIMALAVVALVCYIFWYYYQLDTTLLVKSFSMLAVGVTLLLIHWMLIRNYFAKHLLPLASEHAQHHSTQHHSSQNHSKEQGL